MIMCDRSSRALQVASAIVAFVLVSGMVSGIRFRGPAAAQGSCIQPTIDHLEFVQSVQEGQGVGPNVEPEVHGLVPPIVDQIDGKHSAIRAYVKDDNGAACQIVGATLAATSGGNQLFNIRSYNAHKVAPLNPPGTWARDSEDATVNFEFSLYNAGYTAQSAGRGINFTVCLDTGLGPIESCATQSVLYKSQPSHTIVGYPVACLSCSDIGLPDSNLIQPGKVDIGYWQMYPVPTVYSNYFLGSAMLYGDPNESIGRISNLEQLRELVLKVALKKIRDKPEAILAFGFLRNENIRQIGTVQHEFRAAVGNTFTSLNQSQWTFAHELVHLHGEGDVSGTTSQLGWDVGNLLGAGRIRPLGLQELRENSPTASHNVNDTWVGQSPYERIMDMLSGVGGGVFLSGEEELEAEDSRILAVVPGIPQVIQSGGTPTELRVVSGGGNSSWVLDPTSVVSTTHGIFPSGTGEGTIKIRDSIGTVLYAADFSPLEFEEIDGSGSIGNAFIFTIPMFPGEDKIELYKGGVLQDTITQTVSAPTLSIAEPLPSTVLTSTLHVSLSVSDTDSLDLLSSLNYSHNSGVDWVSLVEISAATSFEIDTAKLPGGTNGILRATVTDGMNTSSTQVGGLLLSPDRPPIVEIVSPISGTSHKFGVGFILTGSARDLEDGDLDDTDYFWWSDQDGPIGNGRELNWVPTSLGPHDVTLGVTDSASNVISSTVRARQAIRGPIRTPLHPPCRPAVRRQWRCHYLLSANQHGGAAPPSVGPLIA